MSECVCVENTLPCARLFSDQREGTEKEKEGGKKEKEENTRPRPGLFVLDERCVRIKIFTTRLSAICRGGRGAREGGREGGRT